MKIAIKGHKSRGKEVIQILESLGGSNTFNYNGDYIRTAYFIGMDYNIYGFCTDSPKVGFKVYTLEEFEREFPFKIGDRVISATTNFIGTITKLKESGWYYVKHDSGNLVCVFRQDLKLYKEMKEERNITLTLDKAKEWYKKGGELKEVALQAYSEEELKSLPRSWEEFCNNYMIDYTEAYFDNCCTIHFADITYRDSIHDKNICPSKESAEAHLAMIQLEQLRNCWWGDWEPKYDCGTKYIIKWDKDDLIVATSGRIRAFLIFPTRKMAEEFLKCFRDLIEKAGDLI